MSRSVVTFVMLAFLAVLLRTAWLGDDALITLRTVLNVTHGYGLTFNIAERVQTFTHPLWLFLITGSYLVVGNVYYAAFALAIVVSLAAFGLAFRRAATPNQAWLAAAILVGSTAYVDYATSGLENPLSNLLLALFVGAGVRAAATDRPALGWLWGLGSLLYLTRPDDVLIVAPALVGFTLAAGGRGDGRAGSDGAGGAGLSWRPRLRAIAIGLLPAALWTLFSLVYYGFPFPNTAYAKLATGVDRGELWQQGAIYLLDSVDRDPITMIAIVFGAAAGLARRGLARWVAIGIVLHLAYVVSIGGDFMAGRFLVAPLFAAVLVLTRLVPMEPRPALVAAGLAVAIGLTGARWPPTSDSRFERTAAKDSGIVDERAVYFRNYSLVWASRASFREPEWPDAAPDARPTQVLDTCGLMGASGLDWGPLTHLLDECALADPLLARLPAVYNTQWRTGHFRRMIPAGYRESLEQGTNVVRDPALRDLYADIRVVTRTQHLLSADRLKAIWRVNTGASGAGVDRRFYRHAGSLATLDDLADVKPDGTVWNAPGVHVLTVPLTVVVDDRPGRRYLDVSLDANDRYQLLFLKTNAVVAQMEVGPIPQHRRSPGLASFTEDLPPSARDRGFDMIVVAPLAGDDAYSIGHLLLDGNPKTDALLAERVAARDRNRPR